MAFYFNAFIIIIATSALHPLKIVPNWILAFCTIYSCPPDTYQSLK